MTVADARRIHPAGHCRAFEFVGGPLDGKVEQMPKNGAAATTGRLEFFVDGAAGLEWLAVYEATGQTVDRLLPARGDTPARVVRVELLALVEFTPFDPTAPQEDTDR